MATINMTTWTATFIAFLTLFAAVVYGGSEGADGKGFGDNIEWWALNDGLAQSKSTGKPLMLIIHKTWCGACKALKPKFAASTEIESLSKKFIMVNVQDDEEPSDSKYVPDGGYIPRILFLNSVGEVQTELINKAGNPKYKYYYPDVSGVVATMNEAHRKLGGGGTEEL
ncbi:thioredoxin domain-containing protein 12-like [Asterias amurensis]|uniref:thioredoxin domain-containing protein 12-like n=1 Tax=Asterias amurensis TaxID=7602 RepID=UPI003AB19E10